MLAALAVLIGFTRFKKLTGLRKTRTTVSGDIALIKRDDSGHDVAPAGTPAEPGRR